MTTAPYRSNVDAATAGRRPLRRWALRAHRSLVWLGGLALLLWGLSGMTHVIMASFGPQQATFLPPQRALDLGSAQAIDSTLGQAGVTAAQALRIVVGSEENLLQVTTEQGQPRRYFRLADGQELLDHDGRHAEFVARHFLGEQVAGMAVADRRFVTAFSSSYPAVNRLLPVWRVAFDDPDGLTAYVYTETNALAAVDNHFKTTLQQIFQLFHTWSWMPEAGEWLRVLFVALLMASLVALAGSGVVMLVMLRRSKRAPGLRGGHRLAGYLFSIPILMFAVSGLWHLLHSTGAAEESRLLMSPPMQLHGVTFPLHAQWQDVAGGLSVNNVSIVQYDEQVFLYRLGLASPRRGGPEGPRAIRHARFDGLDPSGPAFYVHAGTGELWVDGDRELALALGERFSGRPRSEVLAMEIVTRFGAGYDFRNKRLPVWRLDYGPPLDASVFVDTATGVQADRALAGDRFERFSFTYLHKWNFLRPLGRDGQNLLIAFFVLGSVFFMAGFGLWMAWKRGRSDRQ